MRRTTDRAWDALAYWCDTASVAEIARAAAGLKVPTLPRAACVLGAPTIRGMAHMQLVRIVYREEMTGALVP